MTTRRIELRLDELGRGSLYVDGVDIASSVSRLVVSLDAGDRPRVELTLWPTDLVADLIEADVSVEVETPIEVIELGPNATPADVEAARQRWAELHP